VHYADDVASEKARRAKFLTKSDDLRACPFCRELFVKGESDDCPECGIPVRDIAELPPSPEAERLIHEEASSRPHEHTIPQAEPLPLKDMSRGRGPLLLCALLGLAAFYLPWAVQTMPENVSMNGAEMAHKAAFFWSSFTAWLVLFPAVASRRTILKMHGARPAIIMLASLPAVWCGFLLSKPTRLVVRGVPFEYHWGYGFWATFALSALATAIAFRFGGRLDDVPVARSARDESTGEIWH
jgi:hypothetical protein